MQCTIYYYTNTWCSFLGDYTVNTCMLPIVEHHLEEEPIIETEQATVTTKSCPPDGVWSEWTTTGTCATTCGSQNNATRKRTCTNDCGDCPCSGPSEDSGPCGIALCPFPAKTCMDPYVKALNGATKQYFCGIGGSIPAPVCSSTPPTVESPKECPPDGVWSEWVITGTCATTCGSQNNATRKRTCTNDCGDCPCRGPSEDSGPCGIALCPFPAKTCMDPYVKALNGPTKQYFCGIGGSIPAPVCSSTPPTVTAKKNCPYEGIWGEWTTTGSCPTSCGSCSNATRTRTCLNTCGDCPCAGPSEDVGPCGIKLCTIPDPTCCKPYEKSLNGVTNNFFCGRGSFPAPDCNSNTL